MASSGSGKQPAKRSNSGKQPPNDGKRDKFPSGMLKPCSDGKHVPSIIETDSAAGGVVTQLCLKCGELLAHIRLESATLTQVVQRLDQP